MHRTRTRRGIRLWHILILLPFASTVVMNCVTKLNIQGNEASAIQSLRTLDSVQRQFTER
jgi:hypothetical protein